MTFNRRWKGDGTKEIPAKEICVLTVIPRAVQLNNSEAESKVPRLMYLASSEKTTREEDMAHSVL
jgi:hypothetical protein